MRKNYWILIIGLCSVISSASQSISYKTDSLKVDSIKKILPVLKGINKIESMIFLCEYYGDYLKDPKIKAGDSIQSYGNKILSESNAISYKRGIAMGLIAIAATDSLREKNAIKAMQIGKEINDEEVMGWATVILNTTSDQDKNIANTVDAINHFNKAGKFLRAAYLNTWLCETYFSSGKNEKAFDCARNNLAILKTIKNPDYLYIYTQSLLWSYWNMSVICSAAGDYEQALQYLQKTSEVDYGDNPGQTWGWALDISGIYAELGKFDSALLYWNRFRYQPNWDNPNEGWEPGKKLALNHLARLYSMNNENDKAIELLKENIIYFKSLYTYKNNNPQMEANYRHAGDYGTMVASLTLSRIYDSVKNYQACLQYGKDAFKIANAMDRKPEMMQASQSLSRAYHHLKNNDSAYSYLEKYVTLKDSIQSKQFLLRIYNSKKEAEDAKKESRIGLLDRDNKIKQQQLKQEATFRYLIIAAFIALLFAALYIFRNINLKRKNERLRQEQKEQEWKLKELENENKHIELQKQAADLEMQALRAQMNPHFIFNSLSSINHFILKNESRTASNYLTRFSRLMRMVLNNSQKPLIALEDELEMLELYLEMERLRFKNSFDYGITYLNKVDSDNIFIPPLLLQPFCENAIWHGLMNKEGQGRLDIELSLEENILNCVIRDNGVGREKAEELKSKTAEKEKSMGLKITTERLALLNREKGLQTFYKIEDLKDENGNALGTKVNLKIGYKQSVEETA